MRAAGKNDESTIGACVDACELIAKRIYQRLDVPSAWNEKKDVTATTTSNRKHSDGQLAVSSGESYQRFFAAVPRININYDNAAAPARQAPITLRPFLPP